MRATVIGVVLALALVMAAHTFAAGNGPAKAVYGSAPYKAQQTLAKPQSEETSSLPFTGLDLGIAVAAGLGMAGIGVGLRRMTRKPPAD